MKRVDYFYHSVSSQGWRVQWESVVRILGAMALTDATSVLTKTDIEDPMERIFHALVLPDGVGETYGITGQRDQEIALLDRDRPAHVAL